MEIRYTSKLLKGRKIAENEKGLKLRKCTLLDTNLFE